MKKYYIKTGLMALIVSPALISAGYFGMLFGTALILPVMFMLLFLFWFLYAKKANMPEKASQVFLPVLAAFGYYIFAWIVSFGFFGYSAMGVHIALTVPYFFANFMWSFSGGFIRFVYINIVVAIIVAAIIIGARKIDGKKIIFDKKILVYAAVFVCLSCAALFQHYWQSLSVLGADWNVGRVEDEVNLYEYYPFSGSSFLKSLGEPPSVTFSEDYPRLDGATAAYPVYAAIAQELYTGLNRNSVTRYVECSKTDMAYERLINGEIDIFFGAQPSRRQIDMAQERGLSFELTPVAKEAFVFFVHKDNPVNSLTVGQIQDIYQKKINNWRRVGGKRERIMPFQRPENSGSQTVMLAMVMGDKALPEPLREEYIGGMGEMINQVAAYRNYSSALGYSFRYFATGMKPNPDIKLLAVDGIEPALENIRTGAYPFTVEVYAVTIGARSANTDALINWILSEQGQNFIEICGYVRID